MHFYIQNAYYNIIRLYINHYYSFTREQKKKEKKKYQIDYLFKFNNNSSVLIFRFLYKKI